MPTISPTTDPSADFTALPGTFDPEALAVSAEDFVVPTFCRDAQPDRVTKHTISTSQLLRHIKFGHPKSKDTLSLIESQHEYPPFCNITIWIKHAAGNSTLNGSELETTAMADIACSRLQKFLGNSYAGWYLGEIGPAVYLGMYNGAQLTSRHADVSPCLPTVRRQFHLR